MHTQKKEYLESFHFSRRIVFLALHRVGRAQPYRSSSMTQPRLKPAFSSVVDPAFGPRIQCFHMPSIE
jgi:hypothetical protein